MGPPAFLGSVPTSPGAKRALRTRTFCTGWPCPAAGITGPRAEWGRPASPPGLRPGRGRMARRAQEGSVSNSPASLLSRNTQHAAGPAWVRAAPGTRREPPCAAAWATPRAGGRAWLSQQPLLRPQASPAPLQPQFPHLHLGPLSKARPLPTAVRVQGQIGPHALPCATLATAVPSLFRKLPLDLCDLQV